jgi:hypothetical protein
MTILDGSVLEASENDLFIFLKLGREKQIDLFCSSNLCVLSENNVQQLRNKLQVFQKKNREAQI